jgi:esterase/lipase
MLRSMPRKKIDEQDLRRRVFMVISRIRENKTIYLHKALEENQVHLLTDDRYGKVRDFLAIAEEKGMLSRSGDGYLKEAAKFSSPYDFHRARIDNPIDVMANAVEPLTDLQRTIRTLAYMPGFILRRKAANLLVRQAEQEFETDYRSFFIEGETKPVDVGRPVLIRGRSRRMGIVLSHGYMAAPLEVRELAEYLRKLGYWVYLPRLPGHGTSPDDLATRSYRDWVHSIDRGYAIMSCLCRGVIAGGFSTGAGLALDLASRVNRVKAVFAVSAPLRLKDVTSKFASAVDMWNRFMTKTYRNGPKKEFVENKSENPHINYLRNPISGVVELERLMDDLEPKLAEISVPTLIIQSRGDPVVDPKSSSKIFEQLGTEDKQYILFNFDRHGILRGPGSDRVHRAIGDFVERVR